MSFDSLGLHPQLLARLAELGYQQPTPIQTQAIPVILAGGDVMAGAQTGTGKTAAFCLPMLHQMLSVINEKELVETHADASAIDALKNDETAINETASKNSKPHKSIRGLILVPTRELAQQVYQSVDTYAKGTDLTSTVVYGGVSIAAQAKILRAGVDIVVATPGRLLDHARNRVMSLSKVQYLVFDEADRMLDMGFKDEIMDVLKRLPQTRQTLLFSATLDDRIFSFSKRLLRSPRVIEVEKRNTTTERVQERVFNVDAKRKPALLSQLITQESWQQVLIFSRTREGADALVNTLSKLGVNAAALHADLSQSVREQVLADFKDHKLTALVATDVAARGLDIQQLNVVVNMELPFKLEDYVHRIGRTGRAGQAGHAVTLLSVDDEPQLIKLEAFLDRRLPQQWYPGFEPDLNQLAPVTRKTKKGSLKQQARQKALAHSSSRGKAR